jgi:hypothetical protein
VNLASDLLRRLHRSLAWVAAQFWLTLLLILIGFVWTRLPDNHAWQVGLTLLIPLLLLVSLLELEAGTFRALADDDGKRVKFMWGAATLLVWVALAWACWAALDWFDDRIILWSGYLNSKASAHWRVTVFTYDHIASWLTFAEWILRWIVVPAKIIPYAMASAQWGWRLPVFRILRMLWNWRWWSAVLVTAVVAVELPRRFFVGMPHGTVSHQVWAVSLKLATSYFIAITCWVLLLAWAAVLFSRGASEASNPDDDSLVPAPVGSDPVGEESINLPALEIGDDSAGKA